MGTQQSEGSLSSREPLASEIAQGSGSPLRARLQTDLERLGSLVFSHSKLLCSKHVEDGLMLMPAGWGWVLPAAWAPCKTAGPLLNPGGRTLRKVEVELLSDPAGWALE